MLDPRVLEEQIKAMDGMLEILGDQAEKLTNLGSELARIRTQFAAAVVGDDRFAQTAAAWDVMKNAEAIKRWGDEWAPMLRRANRLMSAASGRLVALPTPAAGGDD